MPMPDCKRVVENALDRNMVVKFMVDKLAEVRRQSQRQKGYWMDRKICYAHLP